MPDRLKKMEVRAITKYVKVQPRKVRIVADEVRGKSAVYTAHLLKFHPSKAAFHLRKTLISAIHNAVNNHGLPVEELRVAKITIDEGPRMKRIEQRAMGRAYRIVKKTSHITVVIDQQDVVAPVKPHGTKPKPRPTFATATKKKGGAKAKAETEVKAEEATPVEASEAPEEAGSAEPVSAVEETTPQAEGATGDEQEGKE
jgi:large subunit ribosomal protein L22